RGPRPDEVAMDRKDPLRTDRSLQQAKNRQQAKNQLRAGNLEMHQKRKAARHQGKAQPLQTRKQAFPRMQTIHRKRIKENSAKMESFRGKLWTMWQRSCGVVNTHLKTCL